MPGRERSFVHGRRKGHPLKKRQAQLVEALLPQLQIEQAQPVDPERLFAFSPTELRLEIGFGGGEHLIHQAREHPQIGFIGCEPFINGVAKVLAAIDAHGLENIRLHEDDATTLLDRLPVACFDRVDLLYPDPWPKRRHWKRRFVSPESLDRLARVMKPGAELRFATDSADYAAWTLAAIGRHDGFSWPAECADDWRLPWPDWCGTRYEEKALRADAKPVYLTFLRR
ncbi:MAG: tRNA (guanosine(46)-N7)-methyltransferase TrmB [Hyphomicrobiales bacterium]|nr:tRNA (guanosine(46)-N7)-methyltransferase TrmB [Hyphomicrobiales bacterium]